MKKKVAFITNINHGGITTVLTHVIKSKKIRDNFELSIFVFKHSEYIDKLNEFSNFIKVDNPRLMNKIMYTIRLIWFLISFNGSAIVCLGPIQVKIASIVRKIFKKRYKIISWIHVSSVDPGIGNKFNNLIYADYNLAISSGIKKEQLSIGIPENKIGLIFNPIKRKEKTITGTSPCTFIYVGRIILDGQKNLRGLLEFLSDYSGNWKLDIYGSGPDSEETKKIIDSTPNLAEKITLKGWVKQPFKVILKANALLLNSNFEGLPMVLAEALSYGIPCVSSNCKTGPDDLIKPGINGYLYPVGDYTKLKIELDKIINNETDFNSEDIKNSIEFLYNDNYDDRFIKLLNRGINL